MSQPLLDAKLKTSRFTYFLLFLLVIRLLVNIYGFDIVPYLSNNDEAIIQDQSFHFYRSGIFKALSFHGQLIDTIGAHHPPLFPWIQSVWFRILGFSPSTLRVPSILYSFASLVTTIYCLYIISYTGLVRKSFANLCALILLFDPIYLSWSRFGRHDTLANLLATISIALLFLSYSRFALPIERGRLIHRDEPPEIKSLNLSLTLFSSSVFMGLALSSHIQSAYIYIFFAAYLLIIGRKYLAPLLIASCLFIPIVILCCIWAYAFRDNLASSLQVFNTILSQYSGTQNLILSLSPVIGSNGEFNPQKFTHLGGTLILFHALSYFVAFISAFIFLRDIINSQRITSHLKNEFTDSSSHSSESISLDNWALLALIAILLQPLLIATKYGIGASRFYSFYPVTIIMTPILLEWIAQRKIFGIGFMRLSLALLSFVLFINIFLFASYVHLVKARQETNSYDKADKIINSLSASVKDGIAAPPVFWLAAHHNLPDKNVQIIENGFVMWEAMDIESRAQAIDDQNIDIVILPKGSRLGDLLVKKNGSFLKTGDEISVLQSVFTVYNRVSP